MVKEIRGPSTSADQKAIEGFIKSQGISNRKFLSKKTINEKEYFFFKKKSKKKVYMKFFQSEIYLILSSVKWKKSMRWASFNEKWSRPIKKIFYAF